MILNAESVTVLVTFTSLGAEVDKPRELVDLRFIQRIELLYSGAFPLVYPVGCVLPRCSESQVACPVVLRAPVPVIDVRAWVGFVMLLAVYQDEFVQVNAALLTSKPCLEFFRLVMLRIPVTEVPRVCFDVIDILFVDDGILISSDLH